METKSRYEVIAELEQTKRELIQRKAQIEDKQKELEKNIKLQKRELEDMQDELVDYQNSKDSQKQLIDELIRSTDDSLKRFSAFNKSQS